MKNLIFLLALFAAFTTTAQQWDIQLPHYEVEEVSSLNATQVEDWGFKYLQASTFWSKSAGEGAVVFVLDTGIETNHPDLRDRIALNYCKDFTNSASGFQDLHGHGTHCAGITAATNNSIGIVGIAPQATLVAVKVLNDSGSGSFSWVANGIRYVADLVLTGSHSNKKKIITMSLGGAAGSNDLQAAIDYAIAKGCFITAAAGNRGCSGTSNTIDFPGKYPQVITVASIGKTQSASSFSSCGAEIDLAAPGEAIYSTHKNGGYALLSGTSMATPNVAGIMALIVSAHKIDTQKQLEAFLNSRARDLPPNGWDNRTGHGAPIAPAYLAPPDGDDPGNPPPPPPPNDSPLRAKRAITLPVSGEFSYVYKANNSTKFEQAKASNIVVEANTALWTEQAVVFAQQAVKEYWADGRRGFGLLDDADLYESARWAAYFLSLITRDKNTTLTVVSMRVEDASGKVIYYDHAKDKARDLPALTSILLSDKAKARKGLKRVNRKGIHSFF